MNLAKFTGVLTVGSLMDNSSVKWAIIIFVFHPILMKLGEVVVVLQVLSKSDEKQKTVLLIARLTL